ncbi:NAD(P)-dependent glycerol-3-phosphate dehydrogenase [candidate division KSB1 bacterium]|nr:NAD(P)-dependent glycerol-3-phosphate dehydrogenase [candidate division KSB1 bacterium]
MNTTSTIAVIGGGNWGTVVANLIASNGYKTLFYVRNQADRESINRHHINPRYLPDVRLSENITAVGDFEAPLDAASLVFLIIPAKAIRSVMTEMSAWLKGDHIIVHGTKGLEPETLKTPSQIILEASSVKQVGAISGPNLALEIAAGHPSATVIASPFARVRKLATLVLNSDVFRVYENDDLIGVELAGALKNIIAIAAGIVNGIGFGDNTKAVLLTRGVFEMTLVLQKLGGDIRTLNGLAGIGDVMATCASSKSRNNQVGFRIGQGEKLEAILDSMQMVAEGVRTTQVVFPWAKSNNLSMPITEAVYSLLFEHIPVKDAINRLMTRPVRHELGHLK